VIRHATLGDADLCAGILTAAFADDPVSRWLVADPEDGLRVHHRYFHRFVRHGLAVGTIEIAGDAACAVWFPSDAPDPDHEPATIAEQYAERFSVFERILHDRHPTSPEHDYLMLLGARADQRGRGLGSALLAHRLIELDPAETPTYLVATTRRSASGVYARAGYRPLGEPIQLPEGLQVYPLWRDPPSTPQQA
jgi:GNAT superfamily N-acetyltransferase